MKMPFFRQVLLAFNATAMTALLAASFGPGLGYASPTPASLSLLPADYSSRKLSRSLFIRDASLITTSDIKYPASSRPVQPRHPQPHEIIYSSLPTSAQRLHARLLDSYNVMKQECAAASHKASNLRESVSKSAPGDINNQDFLDTYNGQLTDLLETVTNIRTGLQGLDAQKGLAFYDQSSSVQPIVKDAVNDVKDLLNLLDDLFGADPILGGSLGKLVYDLKCVIDDVLNIVENVVDEALSALQL